MPSGHEIIGVHARDYSVSDSKVFHRQLDVRDEKAVDRLFDETKFDAVIHAAGMASVDQVERHPEEGRASNVGGTRNIAKACKRNGAFLVYISTNAVFDGENAPYAEDASTSPVHHYGKIKLECEETAISEGGETCIARPILMYGWNHPVNRANPVSWVYEKLLKGESLTLVNDVYENPLYNLQCGKTLWKILEKRPSGIFHLAGGTRVNRYELGLAVAETFNLDASLIQAVDSSHFPSIARRPKDTTFNTTKVETNLAVASVPLSQGLADMKKSMGISI